MANIDISPKYPLPSLRNSVNGLLGMWMEKTVDNLQFCMPAIFIGYADDDRASDMAWVQPLVKHKNSQGVTQDRGKILVPIHNFQHGTFMIDAPLVKGDTGWLIAGDRDNTYVLAANNSIQGVDSGIGEHDEGGIPRGNQGPQEPGVMDSHKYIYGFFLPDKWGGVPLPPIMKDSLVIGQVNPDASSYGRFVMDPDGTIHVLSKRWYDAKDPDPQKRLKGGAIFVDLSWKGKLPTEPVETWRLGENNVTATEIIWGNLVVREWKDPDGKPHGGNLSVEKDATVGGSLLVKNGARVENGLGVEGNADVNGRVVIKHDTSRTVTIDGHDLINGDAKFVKKTIVTGKDRNRSRGGKVYLTTEETYVLADKGRETQPIELSDVVGGGEHVEVDAKSVAWHEKVDEDGNAAGGEELSVKGWHTQKDINGDGDLPPGEDEPMPDYDPEGTGGDVSIESMIMAGNGDGYREYQVLGRKHPGGPLVYIPITKSDSSEDSSSGESSGESSSEDSGDSSSESGGDSSEEPPEPPRPGSDSSGGECHCNPYAYQLRVINGRVLIYLPSGSLYVNGTEKTLTVGG